MTATGCNVDINVPEFSILSQASTESVCQCCMEMKNELLNVKCELNSMIEIMKILKEDHDQLLSRVVNIENRTVNSRNTTNAVDNEDSRSYWKSESSSKRLAKNRSSPMQQFKIPLIVNRYAVLENLHEVNQAPTSSCSKIKLKTKTIEPKSNKTKALTRTQKIVICGDSHARGCASNLLNRHGESFEVIGNVLPGARLLNITQAAKKELKTLNRKDYAIIWGGSNDINKNESLEGLKYIRKFVAQNEHTNIIVLPAPNRHDLPELSCINTEIQAFNRKLRKVIKPFPHVKLLDLPLNREDFTGHGLHLNSTGKEKVSKLIGQHLTDSLPGQGKNVITLPWINYVTDPTIVKVPCATIDKSSPSEIVNETRTSERLRKAPVTRSSDFLW
jgi:lysophospholipase L1-like esterase